MDSPPAIGEADVVQVERWPSEIPLLVLVILASIGIWFALTLSILGIVYAVLIAVFLFVTHVAFIAHVRGSAARIGPEQFPELHARVQELSRRAGLQTAPAAYVMQAGGSLNALATKFFRGRMIVLFSDLLDACGEDAAARDMIVGHELGHIRAGHPSWIWLIVPGMLVPFLGGAYSRARERTCDRYGAALCGDRRGAVTGLAILAAGASRGHRLNASAFVRQRTDLDTGWMTLARWLAGYPPLCDRVAAVDPSLGVPPASSRGPARAFGILGLVALVPLTLGAFAAKKIVPFFKEAMHQTAREQAARRNATRSASPSSVAALRLRVNEDLERFAAIVSEVRQAEGALPPDTDSLYDAWRKLRPEQPPPMDPCDGARYGYAWKGDGYVLWSSGPDGENDTEDDIVVDMTAEGSP